MVSVTNDVHNEAIHFLYDVVLLASFSVHFWNGNRLVTWSRINWWLILRLFQLFTLTQLCNLFISSLQLLHNVVIILSFAINAIAIQYRNATCNHNRNSNRIDHSVGLHLHLHHLCWPHTSQYTKWQLSQLITKCGSLAHSLQNKDCNEGTLVICITFSKSIGANIDEVGWKVLLWEEAGYSTRGFPSR